MKKAELYRIAAEAFILAPEDRAENIWFYRAFAGLRAAWGDDFCAHYNAAVHQAACQCGGDYATAVTIVRDMATRTEIPPKPIPFYSCYLQPKVPTEEDIKRFFQRSFREHFPGRRVNSKFAQQKWIETRDRAASLMQQQYAARLAQYKEREQGRAAAEEERLAKWRAAVDRVMKFRNAVEEVVS